MKSRTAQGALFDLKLHRRGPAVGRKTSEKQLGSGHRTRQESGDLLRRPFRIGDNKKLTKSGIIAIGKVPGQPRILSQNQGRDSLLVHPHAGSTLCSPPSIPTPVTIRCDVIATYWTPVRSVLKGSQSILQKPRCSQIPDDGCKPGRSRAVAKHLPAAME